MSDCNRCLWATRNGSCASWDCRFVDQREAYEAYNRGKADANKWIPVSERLPKYGHVVLWCNEYGSVFTSAITEYIGYSWHIGRKHWGADVVAWMPLPEPWKGEEE